MLTRAGFKCFKNEFDISNPCLLVWSWPPYNTEIHNFISKKCNTLIIGCEPSKSGTPTHSYISLTGRKNPCLFQINVMTAVAYRENEYETKCVQIDSRLTRVPYGVSGALPSLGVMLQKKCKKNWSANAGLVIR